MQSKVALAAIAIATLTTATFASAPRAEATMITFDGLPAGFIGNTYVEQGYEFDNPFNGLNSWGVGGTHSFDKSPGSATLWQCGCAPFVYDPTTLTKVGGGPFNLLTGDFADGDNTNNNFSYQFIFNFADGTSLTRILRLDESVGKQTVQFHYANLLSVQWGNDPGNDPFTLQWDNIFVATGPIKTTPLPAALPLFVAAVGGLGFVGWRRRRATIQ